MSDIHTALDNARDPLEATSASKMNTTLDQHQLEMRIALRHGASALQQMREAHERAVQEIARYEAHFNDATGLDEKANVLNWALTYVCTSVMPNACVNLVADAQAELRALAKLGAS
jgi:hypothetical protein